MLKPLFEDLDVEELVDLHRDAVAEHNCCEEGVKETIWVVEMNQGIQSYTHREDSMSCRFLGHQNRVQQLTVAHREYSIAQRRLRL